MLGFKDAIGISLRPISVSFAIGSEAGRPKGSIGRRARGRLVWLDFNRLGRVWAGSGWLRSLGCRTDR
jgi:hypothetical protein